MALNVLTIKELKEKAKSLKLSGYSTLTKPELINSITNFLEIDENNIIFEYVIHSTRSRSINDIISDKYIYPSYDNYTYCQYLNNNIDYIGPIFKYNMWGNSIIILDVGVLHRKFKCNEGTS